MKTILRKQVQDALKHAGPGKHPSGSPQSVHGRGIYLHAGPIEVSTSIDKTGFRKGSYFLAADAQNDEEGIGFNQHLVAALEEPIAQHYRYGQPPPSGLELAVVVYQVNLEGIHGKSDPELPDADVLISLRAVPSNRIVGKITRQINLKALFGRLDEWIDFVNKISDSPYDKAHISQDDVITILTNLRSEIDSYFKPLAKGDQGQMFLAAVVVDLNTGREWQKTSQ